MLVVAAVVLPLVSGAIGTVMAPLMIVGATSNKLLSVILRRCNSDNDVC